VPTAAALARGAFPPLLAFRAASYPGARGRPAAAWIEVRPMFATLWSSIAMTAMRSDG
jgi:hypothetical protein